MSGALQHIDHLYVDWTRWRFLLFLVLGELCVFIALLRDEWTNSTLVDELSGAINILSTIGKGRGLVHTTEVAFQNYLIIHNLLVVRWVLWKMNHICITMDHFLNARNKLDKPEPSHTTLCYSNLKIVSLIQVLPAQFASIQPPRAASPMTSCGFQWTCDHIQGFNIPKR